MKNLLYIKLLFGMLMLSCKTYDTGKYLYEESELLQDGRVRTVRYWIENGKARIEIDTLEDRYSE